MTVLVSPWPLLAATSAQDGSCGGARVVVEDSGGQEVFALPDNQGQRLKVGPDDVLTLRAENLVHGSKLHLSARGIGLKLSRAVDNVGPTAIEVRVGDYAEHLRGLYQVRGTLLTGDDVVCDVDFAVDIAGFGTAAAAATAATAVAGIAAASVPLSASGVNAKVKLSVQLHRRRPRGWRRWLPAPAWRRTLVSTIIGSFIGLCVTVLLQQAGLMPLSLLRVIWGIIMGGGISFGVGYSLGAIWTYLRPPREPDT